MIAGTTTRRILVVEDSFDTAEILRLILEDEGYHVLTAAEGREALAALAEGAPDLILLDLWMPGMNGKEFLRQLRELPEPFRDTPVLVLSADHLGIQRLELPVDGRFTKPVNYRALLSAIQRHVGRAGEGG